MAEGAIGREADNATDEDGTEEEGERLLLRT
jgi:hypothetical protein